MQQIVPSVPKNHMSLVWLAVVQKMFVTFGGTLHDAEPVTKISPSARSVTVTTALRQYTAKSVVVTAGAWSSKVLKPLGLNLPLKVHVTFCLYTHLVISLYNTVIV